MYPARIHTGTSAADLAIGSESAAIFVGSAPAPIPCYLVFVESGLPADVLTWDGEPLTWDGEYLTWPSP